MPDPVTTQAHTDQSTAESASAQANTESAPISAPNPTNTEQTSSESTGDNSASDSPVATKTDADTPDNTQEIIQTRVKRIGLAALVLSFGILCSRLLGFVREAVIAYQAGAGAATDAYNAAFTLPDIMNYFLAGGTMSITFIPLFTAYMTKNQTERANRLFSLIATTMGVLMMTGIIICMVFTTPLAHLLFPGFNAEQLASTVEMTRIVLPAQIFHYIGSLMMACLMARGQFLPSALAPLVYNLMIIIGGVALYPIIGMKGFSIGAFTGAFLGPFLIPLLFLKGKVKYKPVIHFTDADFKKYIFLTLPLMIGASLTTVDEFIWRFLGSSMEEGSISWLNYARRLVLVPIGLVGQAAGQAALPYLSQLAAKGENEKTAQTLHNTLKNVIILAFVIIAFFVILAEPMVALIYERGKFTAADTQTTANILRILSISIVFWTIQMVTVRAFYAAQNTLRPMCITTIVTLISLPIYWLCSKFYGLNGLAIGSVIGMCLQSSAIVYFYHRQNRAFKPLNLIKAAFLGLILAAITGTASFAGLQLVGQFEIASRTWQILFQLIISGLLGTILAAIAARFLIPEQFQAFRLKFMHKVRGKLHR